MGLIRRRTSELSGDGQPGHGAWLTAERRSRLIRYARLSCPACGGAARRITDVPVAGAEVIASGAGVWRGPQLIARLPAPRSRSWRGSAVALFQGAARFRRSFCSGPWCGGVPAAAAVAYPCRWPGIEFVRPVGCVTCRAAGVHVHDGAVLAVVQAKDRELDAVQSGQDDGCGGAAVAHRRRPCFPVLILREHAEPGFRQVTGGVVMPWPGMFRRAHSVASWPGTGLSGGSAPHPSGQSRALRSPPREPARNQGDLAVCRAPRGASSRVCCSQWVVLRSAAPAAMVLIGLTGAGRLGRQPVQVGWRRCGGNGSGLRRARAAC